MCVGYKRRATHCDLLDAKNCTNADLQVASFRFGVASYVYSAVPHSPEPHAPLMPLFWTLSPLVISLMSRAGEPCVQRK